MFNKLIFFAVFICFSAHIKAQILVQKIANQNLTSIDADFMSKGYQLAYSNMTSETYLFKEREEEWKESWTDLMTKLGDCLRANGFFLSTSHYYYNRVYFNADGTIAALIYQINGFSEDEIVKLDDLLKQFAFSTKANINAKQGFWQYGTLNFK